MIYLKPNQKIYIYTGPVDMRKAVNGLCILLQDSFGQNPQTGDLYLFTNRQRNRIKCLFWDKNGFVLYYKRLERGRFNYSKSLCGHEVVITEKQLRGLLMGLDFYLLGEHAEEINADFF